MGSLGTGGVGRVRGADPDGECGGTVRAGAWRRQPRPDRGRRWGVRGGLRSDPGPLPAGHGLLHILHGLGSRLTASLRRAGRISLHGAGRQPSWQKLREAQQRSRSKTRAAALPSLLGEPALEGQESSGRVWGPPGAVTSRVRRALPPSRRRALNQERLLSDLGCARSAQSPRQSAERMARTRAGCPAERAGISPGPEVRADGQLSPSKEHWSWSQQLEPESQLCS